MGALAELIARYPTSFVLTIQMRDVVMEVRSNDAPVMDEISTIYGRHVRARVPAPRFVIHAIEGAWERDTQGFQDYVLPNGRSKERFKDEGGTRFVVKRSTGLWTVFDDQQYVVVGPVSDTLNQLNNIINSVFMKEMDERGYLICQTAGLELDGHGFVLAGRSGAGKTTTLLKLMEKGGVFVSNDRLLVRRSGRTFEMNGIAKWPRVNAGTMTGEPRLAALLPAEARDRYARMPYDELFALEEKYDVDVAKVYGVDRFKDTSRFERIYYLSWSRKGEGFAIEPATEDDAFWQDFGPNLYRDGGVFDLRNTASTWGPPIEKRYRTALQGARIFVVKGKVDFTRIADAIASHLAEPAT
ncbi:MAG: HprK-related kinase B [Acidobacteriota bacterium]